MTWTPTDYYIASRAARRAWQNTSQQLALEVDGLDDEHGRGECDPGREAVLVVEPAYPFSPRGGLAPGDAEPCRAHAHGELTVPRAAPLIPLPGDSGSASPLYQTAPGRVSRGDVVGRGQEVEA